jgi:hypothetical protein
MYVQPKGCRVCGNPDDKVISELDKDLLEGMEFNTILYKYSGKFSDPRTPLTRTVLYNHRRHLRKSIPAAVLQIPDLGSSATLANTVTNPIRSEGFDNYVGSVEKDKELLELLVNSALEDLVSSDALISDAADVQDSALVLSVRNQLRKSLGEMIHVNKEMTSPVLGLKIGDTNKKLFVEFLLVVKHAAEDTIKEETTLSNFLSELTSQLRKSKEFKYILDEERDRREITESVEKEQP